MRRRDKVIDALQSRLQEMAHTVEDKIKWQKQDLALLSGQMQEEKFHLKNETERMQRQVQLQMEQIYLLQHELNAKNASLSMMSHPLGKGSPKRLLHGRRADPRPAVGPPPTVAAVLARLQPAAPLAWAVLAATAAVFPAVAAHVARQLLRLLLPAPPAPKALAELLLAGDAAAAWERVLAGLEAWAGGAFVA